MLTAREKPDAFGPSFVVAALAPEAKSQVTLLTPDLPQSSSTSPILKRLQTEQERGALISACHMDRDSRGEELFNKRVLKPIE